MSQGPWTAQFSVSQGRVQERSSSIFVFEQGGTRRRPNIYVLTESDPPGDADSCRLVANTVVERVRARRGPLTTALGDGLRVAHGRLIATPSRASDRTRRALPGKGHIGVSCAVLTDNEVYFAQAGPAQAFVFGQGGVMRLAPDAGGEAAPLGGDRTPTVTLHHHTLGDGDFVLLSSPQLPSRLRAQELPLLAGLSPEEAVRGLYVASQGDRHYSAILFGLQSAPPALELPQPFPGAVPAQPASFRERRLPRLSLGWNWPAVSRLARLPLLVVALALGVVLVGNATSIINQVSARQTDDRFATLVRQAEQSRNAGMAAADLTQQRALLKQADRMLGEALGLRPDDRRAASSRADIAATLARLNAVFELPDLTLLLDFRGRGVARLEDIWVVDKSAYLLDFESDILYRFPIDPLPAAGRENDALEIVVGKGAPAGTPQPRRVVGMAYVPPSTPAVPGRAGSLVVLDESRNAIGYTPGSKAREIVVRGAATWGELRAAAGFNGSLYILDSKARAVLRYAPTDNGFDSEWKSVLDAAAPADARDLAIDGSIYILATSGQIQRFGAGTPQTLKQDGIDEPLSNPTAIFAAANGRYLYVADGARRIVVFTKEGKFYRQFPLPPTVGGPPYGLFVDEAQGKLYITSEGRLYRASLRI